MSPIRSGVRKQGARIFVRAAPREQKEDRVAYAITVGGLFVMSCFTFYQIIKRKRIAYSIAENPWGRDDVAQRDENRDTVDDGQLHEA